MENPEVFAATHGLIRRLLARGEVTGLRIDHCDGMFNPRQYLIRLQLLYVASALRGETAQGPTAPNGIELEVRDAMRGCDWAAAQGPLYVVVEKILEPRELLPQEWPVRGTSGYDFVYLGNQIFIRRENERRFTRFYEKLTGEASDPEKIIYESKLNVMRNALSSEMYVLTNLLSRHGCGGSQSAGFHGRSAGDARFARRSRVFRCIGRTSTIAESTRRGSGVYPSGDCAGEAAESGDGRIGFRFSGEHAAADGGAGRRSTSANCISR